MDLSPGAGPGIVASLASRRLEIAFGSLNKEWKEQKFERGVSPLFFYTKRASRGPEAPTSRTMLLIIVALSAALASVSAQGE